jgi:hypothetical protein
MIDRQQLESILGRRFPGAPLDQIAAAANAIMGLDREGQADPRRASDVCECGTRARKGRTQVASALPPRTA